MKQVCLTPGFSLLYCILFCTISLTGLGWTSGSASYKSVIRGQTRLNDVLTKCFNRGRIVEKENQNVRLKGQCWKFRMVRCVKNRKTYYKARSQKMGTRQKYRVTVGKRGLSWKLNRRRVLETGFNVVLAQASPDGQGPAEWT